MLIFPPNDKSTNIKQKPRRQQSKFWFFYHTFSFLNSSFNISLSFWALYIRYLSEHGCFSFVGTGFGCGASWLTVDNGWGSEGTLTLGLTRLEVVGIRFLLCETVEEGLLDSSTSFPSSVFSTLLIFKKKKKRYYGSSLKHSSTSLTKIQNSKAFWIIKIIITY